MSLTQKLLSLDAAKYKEKKVDTLEIKRLSQEFGEPFHITIQEVDGERLNELQTMILDKKGKVDHSKTRNINALVCVEGIIEPSLKDEKLQKHFGAASPKELAFTLFKGSEIGRISDAIVRLCDFPDDEEEIKN